MSSPVVRMTAHPRTDPVTGELILFGSTFYPPFVTHSVIGPQGQPNCLSVPIPGISSPKMVCPIP
jgi:carotenoid cleavage dioxygenase-like enzyme